MSNGTVISASPGATIQETCELIKSGRTKVYQLVASGTLKSVRIGRRRLILRSSIDALFEQAA